MRTGKIKGSTSRRAVIAAGAAAGGVLLAGMAGRVLAEPGPSQSIRLKPQSAERPLPTRFWGYNSPAPYITYEMPAFVPAVKALGPHFLRFPGGTVGNYYNWHSGYMEVPDAGAAGSVYREWLVHQKVPQEKKAHPEGMWVEDWSKIAEAVDANLVIEANLETSTPEDQAAWFADMKAKGVAAGYVEMGTEFFLAMDDDMGRKRFPDPETTTKLTKEFCAAIRPHLPADAKVAVQSSSSMFELRKRAGSGTDTPLNDNITLRRIREWDAALKPEAWFDAVTIHFYPKEIDAAGMDLVKKLPASAEDVFAAMIARADSGFDEGISDVVRRVPGKEIWMSEYGAFDPQQTFYGMPIHFTGLWLHQVTREMLTMMRHPQLTVSCFHALKCDGSLTATFATEGDRLRPINAAAVQSWFFHASRGPGCTWQGMTIDGAAQIAAKSGARPGETYWDVDAGLFRKGAEHTLFIHNASKTPRRIDVSGIVSPLTLLSAETIATPDLLTNFELGTPVPQQIATKPALEVPAYSITRVTWSA
jgi:hypothetical protein